MFSCFPPLRLLLLSVVVNVFLHVPFAYFLVVINLPQNLLVAFINESHANHYGNSLTKSELATIWGLCGSGIFLFGFFGSFLVAPLADKFGRKFCLFVLCNVGLLIGAPLMSLSQAFASYECLIAGRMVMGIVYGMEIGLIVVYITECSPPKFRGMMASHTTIWGTLGLAGTYVIGLPQVLGNEQLWPYLFLVPLPLTVLCLALYPIFPESPKYLYIHKRDEAETIKVLKMLHSHTVNIEETLSHFDKERCQTSAHKVSMRDVLRTYHLRQPLLIGTATMMCRITVGVTVYSFYSTSILTKQLKLELLTAKYASILLVLPQCMVAFLTSMIIDRVGRRPLFLGGVLGMTLCNLTLMICSLIHGQHGSDWSSYLGLCALILSSWLFPLGPTPVGLFFMSEITPQGSRAVSTSFALLMTNAIRVLQAFLYPILQESIGAWAILVLLIAPTVAGLAYLYVTMPETKQKSVDVIVDQWIKEDPTAKKLLVNIDNQK